MDNNTDIKNLSINVIIHGNFKIQNLTFPKVVEENKPFTISYSVSNLGNTDTAYGYITYGSGEEIPNSRWTQVINGGYTLPITLILSINGNLNGTLHIGYVKL